ncbi:MAG TPA: TlpA disulfide reductase family protein [Candidatus Limnocylindrales bacterium]|jgi:peroxiredoxin|nr:TlpA disulfide reductase family protein [Candidatus Limnocylindrales bacterium]
MLVGVALLVTLVIVGFVLATRPGPTGGVIVPDTIARGQPVPNIAGSTIQGATVDLAGLRGRPVIVNFWGPSCPPCVTELPLLAAKMQEHAADGLVVLGVLTDDPVGGALDFAKAHQATWPTVIDPAGAIKAAYRVVGRPQSYFVDRSGILRSIAIGPLADADFERQFALIAGGS